MNISPRIGIATILLLATAISGCQTMRTALQDGNITAVRDLTYHGMNALHQGQPHQAESLLARAVQASPDDQRIRQHLANAMVHQGKTDEAIQQLQIASQDCCHDPRIYVELGNLHLTKQQVQEAMQCADAALRINRQMPCAWVLRGNCQRRSGDLDSALVSFHRAASLPDVHADVQVRIAETYRAKQKPMQALNALEIYTDNFGLEQVPMEAVLLTAATLVDLKQPQQAAEELAAATKRPDATPEAWLALSDIQKRFGDSSSAIMTARNAQLGFPDNQEIAAKVSSLMAERDVQKPTGQTASLPVAGRTGAGVNY